MTTPREDTFARLIGRFFDEAWWIAQTGQFPDGEPLSRQSKRRLWFWKLFIQVIVGWQMGAGGGGAEDADELKVELPGVEKADGTTH